MPIQFAVKIVRLKVYIIFSHSDDLALHSGSQLRLKLDKYQTGTIIAISRIAHMIILASMTLTLMQGHSGSAKTKKSVLNYFDNWASNKQYSC